MGTPPNRCFSIERRSMGGNLGLTLLEESFVRLMGGKLRKLSKLSRDEAAKI